MLLAGVRIAGDPPNLSKLIKMLESMPVYRWLGSEIGRGRFVLRKTGVRLGLWGLENPLTQA